MREGKKEGKRDEKENDRRKVKRGNEEGGSKVQEWVCKEEGKWKKQTLLRKGKKCGKVERRNE